MALWGYGELDALIAAHSNVKNGLLIDTNILVAATYELDKFHEPAVDLIDALIERSIPLFCNINIRAEFLDIHRRIFFPRESLDLSVFAKRHCCRRIWPAT